MPAGGNGSAAPLGVVLLPAGRLWDVLILPGDLGQVTLDVLRLRVWEEEGRTS